MNLPFKQHILICTGPRCGGERHSERIRQEFRRQFVRQSLPASVKDTPCICFGLCSHGPNVIIYPDGVVYSGVQQQDVAEIVREHLLRGRVVERLLLRKPSPGAAEEADPGTDPVPGGSLP